MSSLRSRNILLTISAVVIFIGLALLLTSSPAEADDPCCPQGDAVGTVLYFKGSNANNGDLAKDRPVGDDHESTTIFPGSGNEQYLGTWTSTELEYDWSFEDTKMEVQLPAIGTNVIGESVNTTFRVEVHVGNVDIEIHTEGCRLNQTMKYFRGEKDVSLSISAGQTIEIDVYVREIGATGGQLRWDSEEANAFLSINASSSKVKLLDRIEKGNHVTYVEASSPWGLSDIDDFGVFIYDESRIPEDSEWSDYEDAKLYDTSDSITVDWTTTSEGDTIKGVWVWKKDLAEMEGVPHLAVYADGGEQTPPFSSSEIEYKVRSENNSNMGVYLTIIGIMLLVGGGMAAYQKLVLHQAVGQILMYAGTITIGGIIVMAGIYNAAYSDAEQTMPDFVVETLDDETIDSQDLEGKVVVISFGGAYCDGGIFVDQGKEMVKAHEEFKDDDDVVFISVNIEGCCPDSEFQEFKDDIGADWAFIKLEDGNKMISRFKITSQPTIKIIDEDGVITFSHQGSVLKAGKFKEKIEESKSGIVTTDSNTFTGSGFLFALILGIVGFFCPCAFALLPGYMTTQLADNSSSEEMMEQFEKGEDSKEKADLRRLLGGLKMGVIAMAGLIGVFMVFALLGWVLEDSIASVLEYYSFILGPALAILGVMFVFHIPLPSLNIGERVTSTEFYSDQFKPFVERTIGNTESEEVKQYMGVMGYGAAYASASMGCHGPFFIAILLLGLSGGFAYMLQMIFFYGFGMGIVLVAISILVAAAKFAVIDKIQKNIPAINRISGLMLIFAGIYIFIDVLGKYY